MNKESLIDLNQLQGGMLALTSAMGAVLSEAAAVCLEYQHHHQGVIL